MRFKKRHRPAPANRPLSRQLAKAELEFKRALVEARKDTGLSQEHVAALLGVSKRTIAEFERVDSDPNLSMVRHYAHAVGALVSFYVEPNWTADVTASLTPIRGKLEANFDIQSLKHLYFEPSLGTGGAVVTSVAFGNINEWIGEFTRTATRGGAVKDFRLQEMTRWDGG